MSELHEVGVLPEDWDVFFAASLETVSNSLKPFYHGLPDNSQSLNNTNFVALDFETSGLDACSDSIVSIGLVPFTLDAIDLANAQSWLLKPDKLTTESITIHGIRHQEIFDAPLFEDIIFDVLSHLTSRQVVVHYRYMEREFFRRAMYEKLGEILLFPVIDTLEYEAEKLREERKFMQRLLRSPLPSLRLAKVRERYGLPLYENHNALTDALATAELFIAQTAYSEAALDDLRSHWR